jgi:ribosomal protein S1
MKDLTPSAWEGFVATHRPGDIVRGKVSRFTSFGVFVELGEGLEGLCHISELSDERVENAESVVQLGQELDFKILRIENDEQKIGLSYRAVGKEDEPIVDTRVYSSEAKGGMASLGELANLMKGSSVEEEPKAELSKEEREEAKKEKKAKAKQEYEEAEAARIAAEAEAAAKAEAEPETPAETETEGEPAADEDAALAQAAESAEVPSEAVAEDDAAEAAAEAPAEGAADAETATEEETIAQSQEIPDAAEPAAEETAADETPAAESKDDASEESAEKSA